MRDLEMFVIQILEERMRQGRRLRLADEEFGQGRMEVAGVSLDVRVLDLVPRILDRLQRLDMNLQRLRDLDLILARFDSERPEFAPDADAIRLHHAFIVWCRRVAVKSA